MPDPKVSVKKKLYLTIAAEEHLKTMEDYLKSDFKGKCPLIADRISIVSSSNPLFKDKRMLLKTKIFDLNQIKEKLIEADIKFKEENYGEKGGIYKLNIGNHVEIKENFLNVGVDGYEPTLTNILIESLIKPIELDKELKRLKKEEQKNLDVI